MCNMLYCITGIFGGHFNLAGWQIAKRLPIEMYAI